MRETFKCGGVFSATLQRAVFYSAKNKTEFPILSKHPGGNLCVKELGSLRVDVFEKTLELKLLNISLYAYVTFLLCIKSGISLFVSGIIRINLLKMKFLLYFRLYYVQNVEKDRFCGDSKQNVSNVFYGRIYHKFCIVIDTFAY